MQMLPAVSYIFLSCFLFLPRTFVCHIFPVSPLFFCGLINADISISLLAVVVGFCGLALLVVSLFVFWKLCWPIWRSKTLSAHAENGLHVGFPEAPPPSSTPVIECKVAEVEKKHPPEVKVNGRSNVKYLEGAMKISQTSPDIPAEVQIALREKISKQPTKIQRQTTEPTSSSRYQTQPCILQTPPCYSHMLQGGKTTQFSTISLLWFKINLMKRQ